jgi:peptidoglycan L-alanyl-D-glutamate endopeptidase CwlK
MSRKLDDLSPRFRPFAFELLARCVEAGVPVIIVDTRRTPEEQATNLARGVSWTKNSRHLTGDAIDIAPFEIYQLHGPDKLQWNPADPAWRVIGRIGEALGLRWGGRWRPPDMAHFEFPIPYVADAKTA